MPYEPFYERFGKLALTETRSITVRAYPGLPDDKYGFIEAFCNDENCDCRRVIINVASRKRNEIVAVIAYGWEDEAFYARWYRHNDPEAIRELKGPALNSMSDQTELAPALLKLVGQVLEDPEYLARIERHYRMFKERVDPKHFPPSRIEAPNARFQASKKRKRK